MPVSVTMPRLGESVTEGTVTRWLKQEGERVEADEPLLEVSTDKVDTEIPSPAAGVLQRIVVREDETVEVGSELAVIAGEGEPAGGGDSTPATDAASSSARTQVAEAPAAPAPASSGPRSAGSEASRAPREGGARQAAQAAPAEASADASAPARAEASGSATVVKMPALGESVSEGTVTRWLKQVGDTVEADEPLLEVSTDKVDTEIPAPAAGTLLEIKVPEDETVPVGAPLAVIGAGAATGGGSAPAPAPTQEAPAPEQKAPEQKAPEQEEPEEAAEEAPEPQQAREKPAPAPAPAPRSAESEATRAPKEGGVAAAPAATRAEAGGDGAAASAGPAAIDGSGYVTPLVRKLATEHGVDLGQLKGTGVGGRIRRQDVLEAARQQQAAAAEAAKTSTPAAEKKPHEPPQPSPLRGTTEKMSRIRALIARRMVESLQISAQLTTVVEVDVTRIARLREQAKADFQARHGVKLSFLPFFALAAVEALRAHPKLNASIDTEAGTITYHDAEHLGMAVDTEKGLMVPVVHHAGDLNLSGLAKRIADLAERTRTNKLSPDDIAGGTFTLTNTGSRGVLFDTPIINQPQVAILGTGAVVKRAVVVQDRELGELILPRSMVYFALSYDHRLVDGADAARYLAAVKERLEAGNFEVDLGL